MAQTPAQVRALIEQIEDPAVREIVVLLIEALIHFSDSVQVVGVFPSGAGGLEAQILPGAFSDESE